MGVLDNKIALITGGARGIGFAVAMKYIQEGAKVAIAGSKMESSEAALEKILAIYPDAEVMAVAAKMTDTDEIRNMFEQVVNRWGYVDILINNAGVSQTKSLLDMEDEDFTSLMDINVNGVFRCTREAAKIMKEKGGCIINTSSFVTKNGNKNQCAYTTSKFALNGLTKSNARELGEYGIRVNAVAPGVVMTDMGKDTILSRPDGQEVMDRLLNGTPLGKTAYPEDMAGAFVYLASEAASFVTGTIINVDGGIII